MKVESIDHIHIYCQDPEQSAGFYERFFDAEIVGKMDNTYGQTRVFVRLGEQVIVLGPFPPGITAGEPSELKDGAYNHGFGVAHIGLKVEDVQAAVQELRAGGVEECGKVVKEESGLQYAYVAAPDGVVIELTQY